MFNFDPLGLGTLSYWVSVQAGAWDANLETTYSVNVDLRGNFSIHRTNTSPTRASHTYGADLLEIKLGGQYTNADSVYNLLGSQHDIEIAFDRGLLATDAALVDGGGYKGFYIELGAQTPAPGLGLEGGNYHTQTEEVFNLERYRKGYIDGGGTCLK